MSDTADAFPADPVESKDSDEDGFADGVDAFPNDASEQKDTEMPIMIPRENVAAWLDPRVTRECAVRALVEAPSERVFEAVPVSTRLNRVVHDDPAYAAPVGPPRRLGQL